MSFDIYQLDQVESSSDEAERVLEEYIDELIALFRDSPEGKVYLQVNPEMGNWVYQFIFFGYRYLDVTLPHMTKRDVEEILTGLFPAKVSLSSPEEADQVIPELKAFWKFLQREFDLRKAKQINRYLDKIESGYGEIMNDASKFGITKSLVTSAQAEGVDILNEKEMGKFIQRYNAALMDDFNEEEITYKTVEEKQAEYTFPVVGLLTLGDVRGQKEWTDYVSLGYEKKHVPELIRMMLDEDLHLGDPETSLVWAPIHAWRVLGQLKAEEAIEPLVQLLVRIDDDEDDWVAEELPGIFGEMGPAAIPHLEKYLQAPSSKMWAKVSAINGLEEIAKKRPEARDRCLQVMTGQLELFAKHDPTFNGFLILYLMRLKAVESKDIIERAYTAEKVALSICGDWEDVQVELGLLKKRITPSPRYGLFERMSKTGQGPYWDGVDPEQRQLISDKRKKDEKKEKAKRKQKKKSRKQKRKKKSKKR